MPSSLASLAFLFVSAHAQEPPTPRLTPTLEHASPEARVLWERVCKASGAAERAPLSAFRLEAAVRTRSGMQRNDADIDYRYLAPDCIRFILPNKKETGRSGPAPEQYWLRDGDQVVVLAGREYKEDRRSVDDMLALAKNYVALSNPSHLELLAVELSPTPPSDLGAERAKRMRKLSWLALESPDFALVKNDVVQAPGALYRVELGLNKDDLPAVAIVRAKAPSQAEPLLVEFSNYQESQDFRLPFQLFVYLLDRAESPPVFATSASQEVYITEASLRPSLTTADFQPKPKH